MDIESSVERTKKVTSLKKKKKSGSSRENMLRATIKKTP